MKLALTGACALTLSLFGATAFAQDFGVGASTDTGIDTTGTDGGDDGADEEEVDSGEYGGFGNTPLPVPHTERPLTVPEMVVAPHLGFQANGVDRFNLFYLTAGAEFGITDDLMVEAVPLSLQFGDLGDPTYGFFMAGVTYRFIDGDIDIGGRFRFAIDNNPNIFFNPGLPVRVRGDVFRLDTGLELGVAILELGTFSTNDVAVGLFGFRGNGLVPGPGIPLAAGIQIIDEAWAGLGTGFGVADFGEFGDSIFVPLELQAGGTVPGDNGPMVDIDASFGFPAFILSGANDNPATDFWQLGLKATGYLQL